MNAFCRIDAMPPAVRQRMQSHYLDITVDEFRGHAPAKEQVARSYGGTYRKYGTGEWNNEQTRKARPRGSMDVPPDVPPNGYHHGAANGKTHGRFASPERKSAETLCARGFALRLPDGRNS